MSIDLKFRYRKGSLAVGLDTLKMTPHWTRGTDFTGGRYFRTGGWWFWLSWYCDK